MTKTFFGGDLAQEKTGEISTMNAWKSMVQKIPNHRSVIGNHDNQVGEFADAAARADYFLLFNKTSDMVSGTDATNGKMYYYVDDNVEKTRYICLSTGRMWTTEDEVPWCINALNSTPSGWHIVILSHLWLNYDYTNGGVITTPPNYSQSYLDMFDAYNARKSGTTSLHSKAYDFTSAGAKIEFLIGGHIHVDYDFRTTNGIPVILTECDSSGERDENSSAIKGTTTENCVYGIVADYGAGTIKVINVGRGDMRTIQITESSAPDVGYTNQLPIAIDKDGSIYNGIGYKANTKISGSTGEPVEQTGYYTTGFIPCKKEGILRFKNTEFLSTSANITGIATYNSSFESKACMTWNTDVLPSDAWNPKYDDNGDIIQMTVPSAYSSSTAYVRITFKYLDSNSIITVDEEIDSNSGGGAVTPDVPEVPGNMIPTSIDFDGNILNADTTPGYAVDKRYSTSGNKLNVLGDCYATGLIEASPDATIRMRNISTDSSNEYYGVYYFDMNDVDGNGIYYKTNNDFDYILSRPDAFNPVVDENGTIIEFTLPNWHTEQTHIGICASYIGQDSVITVNTPIEDGIVGTPVPDPEEPEPEEPEVPEEPVVTYTNMLKKAVDTDGSLYNGGKGYKDGIYIGGSGETASSSWDSTGYIPCKRGDILRFKNCSVYDLTGANGAYSKMAFYFYDELFSKKVNSSVYSPTSVPSSAWAPVHGADGDLIQVTIPTSYSASIRYVRITMDDITEDSVITVNEEID
jgi:hypothetical protein